MRRARIPNPRPSPGTTPRHIPHADHDTPPTSNPNRENSDPLECLLGTFPCVSMHNLPDESTHEDVLVFFQGLVILDVIVCGGVVDEMEGEGCVTKEAYVVFANPMDYQMAMQRDRQNIGNYYIEVYPAKRCQYYAAIIASSTPPQPQTDALKQNEPPKSTTKNKQPSESIPQSSNNNNAWKKQTTSPPPQRPLSSSGGGTQTGEHTGYLRMRGLPFQSTKREIYQFFREYKPPLDSIVFTYRNDGRATGEAYVMFQSPLDSLKAIQMLHKKSMGSRYIELFISSKEEHGRAMLRCAGGR